MQPVIHSLLETDLYKFTMWQAMLHRHPQTQAEYIFICRNAHDYPLTHLIAEINEQIDHLCTLRFLTDELAYLRGLRFIKSDFVDFLRIFQFQRDFIEVRDNAGTLEIVARGPQVHVMAFEIHVLAIVNELYFRRFDQAEALAEGRRRLAEKLQMLRDFREEPARRNAFEFFDFGVRRRFSGAWHREVVSTLAREVPEYFRGTSCVLLARDLGLVPIGTMAHEFLQTYQALGVRLRDFQKAALEAWVQEYRGDLGVALTDVVGMDAFLADFDLYFTKRRLAPRFGRPGGLGREGAGALRQAAHRHPHQAAGVLGRAEPAQVFRAVPPLRRPHPARFWHRHQPDQRHGLAHAAHRDEADALQRPTGGQAVGLARQDPVRRPDLSGLPAAGLQGGAAALRSRLARC